MKKTLLTLFALFMALAMNAQQASGVPIGYCNGKVSTHGTITSAKKDVWRSAAIHIDRGMIGTFAGCHIDSIRAGLASKLNIDSLVVWLRSSLDGENIAQGSLTKADISKGWNLVALDVPYDIPESLDGGMYIGYSFHQKGSCSGFSVITTENANGGLFTKEADADWEDQSQKGVLSVEALAYGDKLPKVNLALNAISVQPVYALSNGKLKVTASVKNLATLTVSGFKFRCTVDGHDGTYDIPEDCSLAYQQEQTFDFTIDNPEVGSADNELRTLRVNIVDINEGQDENTDDNVQTAQFGVVAQDFTHNLLLEEFTTEQCSNCPRMASYIKTMLENPDYADRVNVICRHAGYYTDWLTATCDDDYLWFFNAGGSTYAPAVMFDRKLIDESATSVVMCPSTQDQFNAYVDYMLSQPAYASLDISVEEDKETPNLLHVTVSGSRSKEDITSQPARISVVATENDIKARSQAGAGKDYMQEHVNRGFNSVWGDEIEWNGNDYTYSCDITIKNDCKRENMQIVAYISEYDSKDATKCPIVNSASISYPSWTTGVESIAADSNEAATYYDLSGKKLNGKPSANGVYIVRQGKTVKKIAM